MCGNDVHHHQHSSDTAATLCTDETFDLVISYNVMEHVSPVHSYLQEIQRVLRPGGLVWVRYYPHWFSPKGHHLQRVIVDDWMEIFAAEGNEKCRGLPFEDDGNTVLVVCSRLGCVTMPQSPSMHTTL